MPDAWDANAGQKHSVGDGCVPAHQIAGDRQPPIMTEPARLDGTDQTGRDHARHIHGKLGEELESLRLLERNLKQRRGQDNHERMRVDMVAVAAEHLEAAIATLLMGSRDRRT